MKAKFQICSMALPLVLGLFSSSFGLRYALIVGRNDGGPKTDSLYYAEQDAKKFTDLLHTLAGFDPNNIVNLNSPDSNDIDIALQKLSQKVVQEKSERNAMFLFYYSGHADGERLNLGDKGYQLEELRKKIQNFPTGIKVAVFDACQSGAMTRFKGGKLGEPFYLKSQDQIHGQVIIASSAANEQAQESDELRGSIFSHHWFNGLRGSADYSGDKKITLSEAYQYAYGKTVETTALTGGGIQHPSYQFKIFGQGEIVLTDLSRDHGGVLLDASFSGRHLILNNNYSSVVADFYKEKNLESFIALQSGDYTIINRRGRDASLHHFSIDNNTTYTLHQDSFFVNPLAFNTLKGPDPYVLKKTKELESSPLSTYSGGLSFGSISPMEKVDNVLEEVPLNQFKLGFLNSLYIQKRMDLNLGVEWSFPKHRINAEMGLNYYLGTARFRPFVGAGTGFGLSLGKETSFSESLGISAVTKIGFLMDASDFLQIGLQVPYRIIFNSGRDQSVGLDLVFLFSSPLKGVRKIEE